MLRKYRSRSFDNEENPRSRAPVRKDIELPRAHIELEMGSFIGAVAWRKATFFPFSITSRLASGAVIRPVIEAPAYDTARYGEAPVIDAVATADER